MPTADLRLLLTTDLHMHLLGYDYVSDAPTDRMGLACLLPMIMHARAEVPASLLLDNGDFLQGTPMADMLATQNDQSQSHPMIAAFNDLNYDAIGLGNHEFDYGLAYLEQTLAGCEMPVLCANARTGATHYIARPWVILDRTLTCNDGTNEVVRIGIIGFVTPQVVDWNAHILDGGVQTDDILAAARSHLPALQRAGADIVVALCHTGISDAPYMPGMENAALHLAAMPGIDVVLSGHTHDLFPSDDFAGMAGVDVKEATLHGKPALMPGAHGNALGQLDLTLERGDDTWRIIQHAAQLRQLPCRADPVPQQTALRAKLAAPHKATLSMLHRPVCTTPRTLSSHFAMLGDDDTANLTAAALDEAARAALQGSEFEDLPLLTATAPHRAGGHQGPENFSHVCPGPMLMRDISAIVPFNNPMALVLRWGWQVRGWLENSSRFFRTLTPTEMNQPLIHAQIAPYHFDTLHGIRYRFDLTVPPRLTEDLYRPTRTRDITYNGLPVRDDDRFVVATTTYRAYGGGGFVPVRDHDIIYTSQDGIADILASHLRQTGVAKNRAARNWQITPTPDTGAWFATAPDAMDFAPDDLDLTPLGHDAAGFQRLRLTL